MHEYDTGLLRLRRRVLVTVRLHASDLVAMALR